MPAVIHQLRQAVARARAVGLAVEGRVAAVAGMAADIEGLGAHCAVGDRVALQGRGGSMRVAAEVVGFRSGACACIAHVRAC